MATIFHIALEQDWLSAHTNGVYRMSTKDRTLDEEGFIHCSDAHQVGRIADALFGKVPDPLVVLSIATERLDAEVRYENLDGGEEPFPHIYGPLPVSAVSAVAPLTRDETGRYAFIRSMPDGCVLCAIVTGDEPARLVMESDRAMALLDINPAGDGHTLVVPKTHADDIWDMTDEDSDEVWRLTRRVADRLRMVLQPEGLTLFQANGHAGWQDVFHFHLHLVPRWSGDRLIRPWESTPADESRLDDIAAQLSE